MIPFVGHVSVYRLSPTCGKEVYRTESAVVDLPETSGHKQGGLAVTSLHYCPALDSIVVTSFDNNLLFLKVETKASVIKGESADADSEDSQQNISGLPMWKMVRFTINLISDCATVCI